MVGGLKAQVIHTLQGNIEVLQASRDQILVHSIQNGDYILPVRSILTRWTNHLEIFNFRIFQI